MDHLPIPDSCRNNTLDVPYLGIAPRYDEQGFRNFPARNGVSSGASMDAASSDKKQVLWHESFLQEWLYFGVLHEFAKYCQVPLDLSTFIREDSNGHRFIDSNPLPGYIEHVLDKMIKTGTLYEPKERLRALLESSFSNKTLSKTPLLEKPLQETDFKPLSVYVDYPGDLWEYLKVEEADGYDFARHTALLVVDQACKKNPPLLRLSIAISIEVLCESIRTVLSEIFRNQYQSNGWATYRSGLQNLDRYMNWCPARRASCLNAKPIMAYIASTLPSYEDSTHIGCNTRACSKLKKTLGELTAKHFMATCSGTCSSHSIDQSKLVFILTSGGIPGLEIVADESSIKEIRIADTTGRKFVAISHVWAHGLGNPTENSLPACQILQLVKLIRGLYPAGERNVMLWVDTLVVPIQPKYKTKAINRLRDVYRNADKVLVVDRHLLQVGDHWLERRLQLLCSEWVRRLWTLQEGRLASSLYIQFRDEAVPIHSLLNAQPPLETISIIDLLHNLHQESFSMLEKLFIPKTDQVQKFQDLAVDLSTRSTTVDTDEPICIATMLGIPIDQFKGNPSMKDIYLSQTAIPEDIVFLKGRRLQHPALCWAPATFLNRELPIFPKAAKPAELTGTGLKFHRDGLLIPGIMRLAESGVLLPPIYYVHLQSENRQYAFVLDNRVLRERTITNPAVIVQKKSSYMEGPSYSEYNRKDEDTQCQGILVSRISDVGAVTNCRYEEEVTVFILDKSDKPRMKKFDEMANHPQREKSVLLWGVGREFPRLFTGKLWCVG